MVLLVDVQEFSYQGAAGIMSVPEGTVMSLFGRGPKLLCTTLAEVAKSYGVIRAKKEGQ